MFNPENHVKLAADDVGKLRKVDVYRLLSACPASELPGFVLWLRTQRPDLGLEIALAMADVEEDVDAREAVEAPHMTLLPPHPSLCQICATNHDRQGAHNAQSLYYATQFQMKFGRAATWADAVAHCGPEVQKMWRLELETRHAWTEPPAGCPVQAQPAGA